MGQERFSVYKSKACFLSSQALKCLSEGKNSYDIIVQQPSVELKEIKESLLGVLHRKPIVITRANFKVYHSVFSSLGNDDFNRYFGKVPPKASENFFLSIHSLKPIPKKCVESYFLEPKCLPGFSMPYNIAHVFWSFPEQIDQLVLFPLFKPEQIEIGVSLLNEMKEGRFHQLTQSNVQFLIGVKIHRQLLEVLKDNSPNPERPKFFSQSIMEISYPLTSRKRNTPPHVKEERSFSGFIESPISISPNSQKK